MRKRRRPHIVLKFMAMSKLIGIVCFIFVFIIVVYSLIEMHINHEFSVLGQLIISAFAFASIYSGFYLSMAKVEHVEEERSLCKKELEEMRLTSQYTEEDILQKQSEINELRNTIDSILSHEERSLM